MAEQTIVERVAEVICCQTGDCRMRSRVGTCCASEKHELARAAIEAMREPTEAMVEAGVDADIPGGRWGEPGFHESQVYENDVPVIWRDMIDVALNDAALAPRKQCDKPT